MNRIKELRKRANMSQIALSMKLNVSQKMISAYENDKSEPSLTTLKNIAEIFDTSIDYIVGFTNIREPIDRTAQSDLTENECELLNEFRQLSKKQQNIALGIILGLKKK